MRTLSIISLSALALGATTFIACDSVTDTIGISSPEARLAGHIEDMAKIMEDNEDEPADGVEELHEYMQDNLPSMMEAVGQCMVDVDKIEDPEDRAERIEEIADELKDSYKDFAKAAEDFGEAIEDDDDAQEYAEEWAESWEDTGKEMEDMKDLMEMMEMMDSM